MLSIEDLQQRLGLSEWQTRRLLDAIRPVLESRGLLTVAPGRKAQISPQAIAVLERAKELNRRGIPLSSLAGVVQSEIGSGAQPAEESTDGSAQRGADPVQSLIEELRARIADLKQREEDLRRERDRLLALLEAKEEQIKALLPGPKPDSGSASGRLEPGLSRWQALKYALLGRP